MTVNENLVKWVKYNNDIFNGKQSSSEAVIDFKELAADLAAQSIQSIVIKFIDKESYTIDYLQNQTKKTMKVLISEIEAI